MNVQYKRARITMILFGAMLLFLVVDYAIVGTTRFMNRGNFLLTSFLVSIVFIVFFVNMYRTEKTKEIVDERDKEFQSKAVNISLIITLMFVFLFCMSLFVVYKDAGVLPVSWIWLLAYLTFSFAYFLTSTIIVVQYWRDNDHE